MRLDPIFAHIEAAIEAQLRLTDPGVAEIANSFLDAFRPALRSAFMDIAEQAAEEVTAQLGDRRVDVRLVSGDPELVVASAPLPPIPPQPPNPTGSADEDLEARITLRLPGSLKGIIEDAASDSGASINSWVVDALRSRARRSGPGSSVEESFEL